MNHRHPANSYRSASLETASPGKLILMLYDGALRFTAGALQGFELADRISSCEEVNNNVIRAQNIIVELQSCLNPEAEGEFPLTMQRLYDFSYQQLQEANLNKDPEPLHVVERILKDIREAWAEMLSQTEHPEAATTISKIA